MEKIRLLIFGAGMLVAALAVPATSWGWGCEGHQTVALIAEKHLNPRALAMVNKILTDDPIDPSLKRWCDPTGLDNMADSASWPDDYRTIDESTGPWHYIDIPLGAPRGDIQKYCPPADGCVTEAIRAQIKILKSPGVDAKTKAKALRFVIHLVGDLHQPLHATTNDDRGGNCVPVTYFDEKPAMHGDPKYQSYSPNLHGIWDTEIVEKAADGKNSGAFADELDKKFSSQEHTWESGKVDVDGWTWESHDLAERVTYGELPQKIAIEAPKPVDSCADDNDIAGRMLRLNENLGAAYQSAAAPVVESQIAKAGIRLSVILNQIWP